jgi:ankyrin repeat protein
MNKNIKKILIQQNLKDFYQNNPKGFYQVTFLNACQDGSLDIVKELLGSNSENFIEENIIVNALKSASIYNQVKIVKHLFTSPICKPFFQQEHYQLAFNSACSYGSLDLVQYLLNSPKLDMHADVNANTAFKEIYRSGYNNGVIAAIIRNELPTLEFLIFEMDAKYSRKIKTFLKKYPNEEATKMFTIKSTMEKLTKELTPSKPEQTKRKTNKI